MALYRDEGIVLRTTKLGEADRIITLLTRNHGKVRAVAKGVRRTKSRFGARLEPFMRADLLLNEGRTFDSIRQAESISSYAAPITADYDRFTAASVIVEIISDLASTEHEPVGAQYMLLAGALNALATAKHAPELIANSYVLRAIALAGWTPRLDSCVVCGRTTDLKYFSVRAGGVMCAADRTPDARRLQEGERLQLIALLAGDWNALDRNQLLVSTTTHVEAWAEQILERPVRSMRLQ
ncbi:DNA repair protein RecO [Bifidobacterium dolichotidis]|uniref:DNA repair protein RecO n=1 Tax=Bifidobacterium dolichotidis TaxID=2306976 RepID=A0A430FRZ6_9BIFI|nr:DNA repair protein RecO [Bifidobacterium dolichotidis]RSX55651.1 DNA repair protein RecO [Bifidobacterium dolichotidis]